MNDPIALSKRIAGKIEVRSKIKLTKSNLALLYTPGVAEVSRAISRKPSLSFDYTIRNNTVAIVSDGSAVLGLGNIGPEAALPVMEGKALLFKELAGVDAFPIVLKTQKTSEIIDIVKNISPTFGAINLEDIAAPKCFEIEEKLKMSLDIPVFHDDQHGTAVCVLAGLINSIKYLKKNKSSVKTVISGSGAAGIAIAKLLLAAGFKDIIISDTKGAIYEGRKVRMNVAKNKISKETNKNRQRGSICDLLIGADIFIGVSAPNVITSSCIAAMNKDPIIFAMSNPQPEIFPKEAYDAGAAIVATGRSDYPNQINNALVFPGIFKGTLESNSKIITTNHLLHAAKVIAELVKKPNKKNIVPGVLNKKVPQAIANIFKK